MKKLQGVICVMCTPYKADESVDFDALKFNLEEMMKRDVGAILVNGGTSEYAGLTEDERFKCAELASKTINGKVAFSVGVTAESTMQAIKYSQQAESVGADALMMSPSPYCKPDWEMTFTHYQRVCASVKIPFIVYNNPGTTGIDINLEQSLQLLNEIENIVYYKDSTGSIQRSRDLLIYGPPKTVMLCGWDDLAMENAISGCEGWISVMSNFAPDICIELYQLAKKRDWEGLFKTYSKMLPMLSLLENSGARLCQTAKYAMDLVGLKGGCNRGPRLDLSQAEKDAIKVEVSKLGLI